MIQKVIHCFWAKGPKTKLAEKCLVSWKRFAPDWEIREWSLADLPADGLPSFVREAVAARQWAMVSDWLRMRALKDFGGLYLDLDVELVQPVDRLPAGEWVAGEWTPGGGVWMNPGSGLALEKGSSVAVGMLESYARLEFDPSREMMAWINERLGAVAKGLTVLDPEVMSPIRADGTMCRTERTVGVHWYAMSWASPRRRLARWMSWHGMRPLVELLLRARR